MRNQKGQVVVEYVLLLVIAVSLAYLLVSQLSSRNSDKPGLFTTQWYNMMNVIGVDVPDKHCPGDPNCK